MDIARAAGCKMILFTDRLIALLANKADVVVTLRVSGMGLTNSYVAPIGVSELILLTMSGRNKAYEERMKLIDRLVGDAKLY